MGLPPNALRDGARVALIGGLDAAIGGGASLAGWFLDVPRMADWTGIGIAMFANTAFCALLAELRLKREGAGSRSSAS